MSATNAALLVVIAATLVLGVVLAIAETALTRISRVKAMTLAEEGRRGAGVLVDLVEHPERFLNVILLVVLATQTVQASLATIVGVGFCAPIRRSVSAGKRLHFCDGPHDALLRHQVRGPGSLALASIAARRPPLTGGPGAADDDAAAGSGRGSPGTMRAPPIAA